MKQYLNEYKGETVLAGLTARLIPPTTDYPDCMCDLLLTQSHLYVLEDNYDDTYTEHFIFPVTQLQKFETETKKYTVNGQESAAQPILGVIGMITGAFAYAGKKDRTMKDKIFSITYLDGKGGSDRLCFRDLENTSAAIKAAFEKVKAQY